MTVIGAGSWGTAVARLLGKNGHDVRLWSHNAEAARSINEQHANPRYLPGCAIPQRVRAFGEFEPCFEGSQAAVFVVPSSNLRATARACAPFVAPGLPVIVLTKGIENDTGRLMTEVVADEVGDEGRMACLCGPNHAEEIARDLPAATVVASYDPDVASFFQGVFHSDRFRVYVGDDVVGVEVCAAAKNVVAIACGIANGIGLGDNAAATIMTRGLAEMSRLVVARGGNPLTCMGLAGMGDLVATCTSRHSRNQTFGVAFVRGETLEAFQARTHMVVEGALACRSIRTMAASIGVEAPLTDAVHGLLYEGRPIEEVMTGLLARVPCEEFYGLDGARACRRNPLAGPGAR